MLKVEDSAKDMPIRHVDEADVVSSAQIVGENSQKSSSHKMQRMFISKALLSAADTNQNSKTSQQFSFMNSALANDPPTQ